MDGQGDGDQTPNKMHQLIEDCFGAVLHIHERTAQYGIDPKKIAVTGDSGGGHLSASMANLIERVGEGGFGVTPGVFEFKPTYLPEGMSVKEAQQSLYTIQVAAPSYGVFDRGSLARFVRDLPADAQFAVAPNDNIPSASVRTIPQYLVLGTKDRTVGREPMEKYVENLKAAGQKAELVIIQDAEHAFFDWKPDQRTKATFAK